MIIGKDGGFAVELVEVGGFDDGISMAGEISVALVIGDDEDNIGSLLREGSAGQKKGEGEISDHDKKVLKRGKPRMMRMAMRLAVVESLNWGKMTWIRTRRRREKAGIRIKSRSPFLGSIRKKQSE